MARSSLPEDAPVHEARAVTHVKKRPASRRLKRSYRQWRRQVRSPGVRRAQDVGLVLLALGVVVIAYAALGAA